MCGGAARRSRSSTASAGFNMNEDRRSEIRVPPDHSVSLKPDRRVRPGERLAYCVQLSEIAPETLFFAGTAQWISINAPALRVTHSGSVRVANAGTAGLKYNAVSVLEDETSTPRTPVEPLSPFDRDDMLLLPERLEVRIPRLAREVIEGSATEDSKARSIEKYLRKNYGYTLQLLPAMVCRTRWRTFLFERRKGHCEYFASAMAVMLRTVGIPSRVVTGFASGVYNHADWHLAGPVRASDAHSWVEAWIAGRGWRTYDPTPADPSAIESPFMARAALFFDAAEQFWQDWILSYDLERQIGLASRVQQSSRGAKVRWMESAIRWFSIAARSSAGYAPAAAALMFAAIIAVLVGPGASRWLRGAIRVRRLKRGEGEASDATLLYQRMLALLERRGIQKPPWLTPSEFARVLPATELSPLVDDLTSAYVEFRFGGKREAAPRMVQLLDRLEKMRRSRQCWLPNDPAPPDALMPKTQRSLSHASSLLHPRYRPFGQRSFRGYVKPTGKTLIVSNHQSFIDGLLLGAFLPFAPTYLVHTTIAAKWHFKILLVVPS